MANGDFVVTPMVHDVYLPGQDPFYPRPSMYAGGFPVIDDELSKQSPKIKGTGTKLDEGKPDYFLIPPNALNEVVRALTYGAKEHDSDDLNQEPNWKSVKNLERRFYSAAQRHQNAYRRGEKIDSGDKGSNCHHLACAIVDLLFVLETELTKKETI